MDLLTQEDVRGKCVDILQAVGASKDQSQFYADALQMEYDTLQGTYVLLAELRENFDCSAATVDAPKFVAYTLKLSNKFNKWRSELEALTTKSSLIGPLDIDKQRLMKNKLWTSLCSLETKQVKLTEGEDVEIADTSISNLIKIRNGSTGDEGYIPALNCVLPSPDSNAKTAIERLQIQLLVCWTDCELKLRPKLYHVMTILAAQLQTQWTTYNDRHGSNSRGRYGGYRSTYRSGGGVRSDGGNDGDSEGGGWEAKVMRRIKRIVEATQDDSCAVDLNRLRKTFCGLENELLRQTTNYLSSMIDTVVNLDKAVLTYQAFRKNWRQFQQNLRDGVPSVGSVIQLNVDDPNIFTDHSKHIRYYQVVLVAEETVTNEETVETTPVETTTTSEDEVTTSWGIVENEPTKAETEPPETEVETTETETTEIETETFSTETETFTTETETETFSTETETFSTEEQSSTSHVESRKFVIRAVIDPRDGSEISMQEAVAAGIIDQSAGMYRNLKTRAIMSIQEAMNEGLILMEYVSATQVQHNQTAAAAPAPPPVKKDKIDSIGLITIRSQVDSCECVLTGVLDAKSGERLELEEARLRGILNDADGYYVNSKTGQHVLMNDAIRAGWVLAEFDSGTAEPWEQQETKTYVINAVMDSYKSVPFGDAVRSGLIDRTTGSYVDGRTGERVHAAEAIRRGLFKAVVVADASALDVDTEDRDVVNQVNKAKRDAMRSVKVVGTIKHAPRGPKDYRRLY